MRSLFRHLVLATAGAFLAFALASSATAAALNLPNSPLFVTQPAAPMTMLVMSKDQSLFTGAYGDMTDMTGNGAYSNVFRPTVRYAGYFDSNRCYTYGSGVFSPQGAAGTNYVCPGQWSGNYLNYLTMTRMDIIRWVLYGGSRSTDGSSSTVLERAFVPQDTHSFGHMYTSVAVDGYNIANYTPYSAPSSGKHILFANTTLLNTGSPGNNNGQNNGSFPPLLRVVNNTAFNIWDWVDAKHPVAANFIYYPDTDTTVNLSVTDYTVRVSVCNVGKLESNCQLYPNGNYKPVGLLQQFGQNDSMLFGLITGSYDKNLSGGVLRKNIGSITNEINSSTGAFTSVVGIIETIDRLTLPGFTYVNSNTFGVYNDCGWFFQNPPVEGRCRAWGNPVASMMYEAMRYFAGKTTPTSSYVPASNGLDAALGLPLNVAWTNPYSTANQCATGNVLVISPQPSFDSDQLPGANFGSISGDLPGLNVSTWSDKIWQNEFGGVGQYFIGQSGSAYDGAPTPKTVGGFSTIRGLAPDMPTKQGSYYSGGVAYYGWTTPLQYGQTVKIYVVTMDTTVPQIVIPMSGGKNIKIIPFAKTGYAQPSCLGGINPNPGQYQLTNEIVGVYLLNLTATSGSYLVIFSDAEQGSDRDMDVQVQYTYTITGPNTIALTVQTVYGSGCANDKAGYVISGTTADGLYLDVRTPSFSTAWSSSNLRGDYPYFLDTPPNQYHPNTINYSIVPLPLVSNRTFTVGAPAAKFLGDPLWYAAKWGGFNDTNGNGIPDLTSEWSTSGSGDPDNYFLVQNPSNLQTQLGAAFKSIAGRTASASSAALNSTSIGSNSYLYQATFSSVDWSGHLLAYTINPVTGNIDTNGGATAGAQWDAATMLNGITSSTRTIITYKPSTKIGIPFQWVTTGTLSLDSSQQTALNKNPSTGSNDGYGQYRLNYLRGSNSNPPSGQFRSRTDLLGDIINSAPVYVGAPNALYPNTWADNGPEQGYSIFKTNNANRQKMVYVGANDGMLHGFDATSGTEEIAYIPNAVFANLNQLTSPTYTHQYYVDGTPTVSDAYFNSAWHTVLVGGLRQGGQGIYALDITNPSNFNAESSARTSVLWEFTDANDSDMGYSYSQPQIGRMANGQWVAVFGNGYNNTVSGNPSSTGDAVLYIVDLATGTLVKKIDTGKGMAQDPLGLNRPNGLATPFLVSSNNNFIVNYIYAGDLFGNMWKFDVSSTSTANWKVAFNGSPLFTAKYGTIAQPITAAPVVGTIQGQPGSLGVYFGTGKYLEPNDKVANNVGQQTFYGLIDNNSSPITGRSQLTQQQITNEVSANGNNFRITTNNPLGTNRGWYMDLAFTTSEKGEEVISQPVLRNNVIIFTTLIPTDNVCAFGGGGWLMELRASNGGSLSTALFDTTGDGGVTTADLLTVNNKQVSPSGIQSQVGIMPTPAILGVGNNEMAFIPGSNGAMAQITQSSQAPQQRQSWRQVK